MPKHSSVLLYLHRNRKAHLDEKPRTAISTFTRQLLNFERGRNGEFDEMSASNTAVKSKPDIYTAAVLSAGASFALQIQSGKAFTAGKVRWKRRTKF